MKVERWSAIQLLGDLAYELEVAAHLPDGSKLHAVEISALDLGEDGLRAALQSLNPVEEGVCLGSTFGVCCEGDQRRDVPA